MEKSLTWREFIITRLIQASGYSAIIFVALIFFFLLREGLPALGEVKPSDLLNIRWYPIENYFGLLPLITGSLIVRPTLVTFVSFVVKRVIWKNL